MEGQMKSYIKGCILYICRLWKDEPENKEIQMECLMDAQTKKQKERQMDEQADGQTKGWTGER